MIHSRVFVALIVLTTLPWTTAHGQVHVSIKEPTSPPAWALLQRQLLQESAQACEEFFDRYFDERGYLQCVGALGRR